jgi:hypothetical protein
MKCGKRWCYPGSFTSVGATLILWSRTSKSGREEVIHVLAVDPAQHVDPGSAVDETADPERASA